MTNQEAIRLIRNLPTMCEFTDAYGEPIDSDAYYEAVDMAISALNARPEIVRCKECKYFELDHFEKVEEFPVPIIVAHEICMKWSDGCRTSKDGWCFMAERRTDDRYRDKKKERNLRSCTRR